MKAFLKDLGLGVAIFIAAYLVGLVLNQARAGELRLSTLSVSHHFSSKDYNEVHEGLFLTYSSENAPHLAFGAGRYINSEDERSNALLGSLEIGSARAVDFHLQAMLANGYERGYMLALSAAATYRYIYIGFAPGELAGDRGNVIYAGFTLALVK